MARKYHDVAPDSAARERVYGGLPSPLANARTLERVKAKIARGGANLTEIARSLGYSRAAGFGAAFRRVVGVSPTEYAKSVGAELAKLHRRGTNVGKRKVKDRTHLPPLPKFEIPRRRKKRPKRKKPKPLSTLAVPRTLEQVKARLAKGNASLADLARSLGYANARTFSTAFRREAGMSPTEYARQNGAKLARSTKK